MLTAAIYTRYSSQLQRATSIEDQVRLCRDAAARFGCDVADAHRYTDEELSGAIGHRPGYQGCASHVDRGPTICTNGRLVRQAVIEQRTLDYLFGDLLAPHRLAYLCAAVDESLARASSRPEALLRRLTRQQAEAQAELEHIAEAIRQGSSRRLPRRCSRTPSGG